MKEIDNNKSFEEIKHIDENGVEFWYARELMIMIKIIKLLVMTYTKMVYLTIMIMRLQIIFIEK